MRGELRERLRRVVVTCVPGFVVTSALSWWQQSWLALGVGSATCIAITIFRLFECQLVGHYTPALKDVLADLVKMGMSMPPNQVPKANKMNIRCSRCYEWVNFQREAEAALMGVQRPEP